MDAETIWKLYSVGKDKQAFGACLADGIY